jgi:basic amino acid/polyamine antiporter, APA family
VLTHTTYFNLVIFIEVAVLAWAIVLLAGVFFPYRRPDIFQKSAIANLKIRGIPVMSIACALGCAAAGLYFANLWFDGFAAGHARHSLSILIGWWVGAFVIYWIMWFIRRRQGVKVELAFKEIPIE